jgi:UDP-glucose 4-epimerase
LALNSRLSSRREDVSVIPRSRGVLVTGGAGFIGSHLVDKLCEKNEVTVFDNLSSGKLQNVERWLSEPNFTFVREDLLKPRKLDETLSSCDIVFHLAANPEVRAGSVNPKVHYEQNVTATFNLLEATRKVGNVKKLVFTSSSTVYGEPERIPTPEDYAPLNPISAYGAFKLVSEVLITSYARTYGFDAVIYRLANITGDRAQHGIVYDFVNKLSTNPERLEILGDGTQKKSYLDVEDCINAMLIGVGRSSSRVTIYNVGSEDQVNVKEIADIACEEMGLKSVKYIFTGGVDGGRGWLGDVKVMLLSVQKIMNLGWKPTLNSNQSVRKAFRTLLEQKRKNP